MIAAGFFLLAVLAVVALLSIERGAAAAGRGQSTQSFTVRFPRGVEPEQVVAFLSSIPPASKAKIVDRPPLVFETIATHEGISHMLTLDAGDVERVTAQLQAAIPGVRLQPTTDDVPDVDQAVALRGASQTFPLAIQRAEATSASVLASLQPLTANETIRVQWLLAGAVVPAVPHRRRATGDWLDADGVADSEELRGLRAKRAELLLRASCRIGASSNSPDGPSQLLDRVRAGMSAMDAPGMRLKKSWLPCWWVTALLQNRGVPLLGWPILINTSEAAGLLGLPLGEVDLPGLDLGTARQLPPLPVDLNSGVGLGISDHLGTLDRELRLDVDDRLRHLHLIGPTGTGKSTLMARMILDDLKEGRGLVVVDPKRDLVEAVLSRAPKERQDDIVVLDPTDTDQPVGLNVLAGDTEAERELVAEHLLGVFQSLWKDSWGPRSDDILRASLLTLVSATAKDGSAFTLVELPELLTNTAFRKFVLGQDSIPPHVRGFWKWFDAASPFERSQALAPVLNKVRAFTMRTPVRLMLGQPQGFDLDAVITEKKVVLVPLSAGELGRPAAELLGSLIVAAVWQTIRSRTSLPMDKREPVFVYLDEFQDVLRLPVDLADLLAQARGLGAGLTLAHQHLSQLPTDVRSAVLATARSQVVFQVSSDDARTLARGFEPSLTPADLMGLDGFHFAMRPVVDGQVARPVTGRSLPLADPTGSASKLRATSRSRFGVARSEVEARLEARLGGSTRKPNIGRRRKEMV